MIAREWMMDAYNWMRANTLTTVVNGQLKRTPSGMSIICQVKGTSGGAPTTSCTQFATLVNTGTGIAVAGGVIYAGDANYNVPPSPNIATGVDSDNVLFITVAVTVNISTDTAILLPGVETSATPPAWDSATFASGYPDSTNPAVPSASGEIVIPIGRVKVTSGEIEFTPVRCGNIRVNHCGGTLTADKVDV